MGMSPEVFWEVYLEVRNVFRNQHRVQHSGGHGPKGGQGTQKCTPMGQEDGSKRPKGSVGCPCWSGVLTQRNLCNKAAK